MSRKAAPPPNDDQERAKRLAAIKLEADLHAYLDALTAVGVAEEEAIDLARATLRVALARVPEERVSARRRR